MYSNKVPSFACSLFASHVLSVADMPKYHLSRIFEFNFNFPSKYAMCVTYFYKVDLVVIIWSLSQLLQIGISEMEIF